MLLFNNSLDICPFPQVKVGKESPIKIINSRVTSLFRPFFISVFVCKVCHIDSLSTEGLNSSILLSKEVFCLKRTCNYGLLYLNFQMVSWCFGYMKKNYVAFRNYCSFQNAILFVNVVLFVLVYVPYTAVYF